MRRKLLLGSSTSHEEQAEGFTMSKTTISSGLSGRFFEVISSSSPQATGAVQRAILEAQLVDVREGHPPPELEPEASVQTVQKKREQIPVSGRDDGLPRMPRQHVAKGAKATGLRDVVGFSPSQAHIRSPPALLHCWPEVLRSLLGQLALAKLAERYDRQPFPISQRADCLECPASGTRVDAGRVRRVQELRYSLGIEATLFRKGTSFVRFPLRVSVPYEVEVAHEPVA
jgi:hypothetical protein